MKTLEKIQTKLKFIGELIVKTPRFQLIALLQFFSGAASVIGLPLLVPVLDYLSETPSPLNNKFIAPLEKVLSSVGIETNFYSVLIVAATLILVGQCLIFLSSLLANNAQVDLSERYRRKIFAAYGKVDWLWLTNNPSGEMYYSVIKEAEMAGVAHLNAQRVMIYTIQISVLLFVTFKLSPVITMAAVTLYGILALLSIFNSNRVNTLSEAYNDKYKYLANDLNDLQQNKKFFKTSLLNKNFIEGIFAHLRSISEITKKQNVRIELQHTGAILFTFIFLVTVLFFYKQVSLSYSALLLTLMIFLRISPQFAVLSTAYASLDSNIPMYQSLHERLKSLEEHEEESGTKRFDEQKAITFEDLTFTYPNGKEVFEKINATIEPNRTTAFIGPSGVGKTTLLDLILRLVQPIAGKVLYGDVIHDDLDKNSLREKIAYVGQQTTLIDGTLLENITIRVEDYTDEQLATIIKKVGLDEVVAQIPDGLNTYVGENGVKLSGGQRQRVALARALFVNPKILILDEATSSLDAEAEALIQGTIKKLQQEFTIIIVTHKLSAVRIADQIYVLEDKKVCESGSYDELVEQKGRFHFLETLQQG